MDTQRVPIFNLTSKPFLHCYYSNYTNPRFPRIGGKQEFRKLSILEIQKGFEGNEKI